MFEDFIEKHPLTDFEFLVAQRSQRRLRDKSFFSREVWPSYIQANNQLAETLKGLCSIAGIKEDDALAALRAFERVSHEVGFWSGREFTLYKAEWLGRTASLESTCPIEPDEQAKASAMGVMIRETQEEILSDAQKEADQEVATCALIKMIDENLNKKPRKKKAAAKKQKAKLSKKLAKKSGAKVKKAKANPRFVNKVIKVKVEKKKAKKKGR